MFKGIAAARHGNAMCQPEKYEETTPWLISLQNKKTPGIHPAFLFVPNERQFDGVAKRERPVLRQVKRRKHLPLVFTPLIAWQSSGLLKT